MLLVSTPVAVSLEQDACPPEELLAMTGEGPWTSLLPSVSLPTMTFKLAKLPPRPRTISCEFTEYWTDTVVRAERYIKSLAFAITVYSQLFTPVVTRHDEMEHFGCARTSY
eukprot:6192556-Pleurochrysis_carterae.AAC.2